MTCKIPAIGFVSLGCPKATVDSERILTRLRAEGYGISPSYETADLVVVNTCGFIDDAVAESLHSIGEAMEQNGKVIVTGCLGVRQKKLRDAFPDLLAITGPNATEAVLDAVHDQLAPPHDPFVDLLPPGGVKLTPRHYAYLKIAEGCNHHCTFCIIPQMRGKLVSRPLDEVVGEAEALVAAGVKELLVVSQDTSAYGVDTTFAEVQINDENRQTRLYDLAEMLGDMGVWVRLHYVYPYPHVDHLLPLMVDGKILPYLDVPFQHANPRILKLMRRPANSEHVLQRITDWRAQCLDIALRSTFIVGFPGETEAEFAELLGFLEAAQLDRAGCFAYSAVHGAMANELPDALPETVKQERVKLFMQTQELISARKLQDKVGSEITVLVDEITDHAIIARSRGDAPEIDGQVIVNKRQGISEGDFIRVEVSGSDTHDLYAEYKTKL